MESGRRPWFKEFAVCSNHRVFDTINKPKTNHQDGKALETATTETK